MADATEPEPGFDGPAHLQAAGRAFFSTMTSGYDFAPHERAILGEACATLDRCEQLRKALRRHGLTFDGRYGPQMRPEVAAERQARAAFASLIGKLGLPEDGSEDAPMPPRSQWSSIVPRRRGVSVEQWEAAVRRKVRDGRA